MTSRQAFEEWLKRSGAFTDWSRAGGPHTDGDYLKPLTHRAWLAWQAAVVWATRGEHAPQEDK